MDCTDDRGEPEGVIDSVTERRTFRASTPTGALFRRLILINGAVFTAGTLVLALSPATVSPRVRLTEVPVLIIGLAVMLITNALLLRASLAPLDALATLMRRVDSSHRNDRLDPRGNGDLTYLVASFNAMLDRLEADAPRRAPRVGRPGGGAAAHRPGAARRDRAEPDGGAARPQACRRPSARAISATSCAARRRRSARAWTRCAQWRAGCARACWTTSGWSERTRPRWPRIRRGQRRARDRRPSSGTCRGWAPTPSWSSTASRRRA